MLRIRQKSLKGNSEVKYKLGIDTGGTFTDLVVMDETGKVILAKVESTPEKPSAAIHNGIEILSEELD